MSFKRYRSILNARNRSVPSKANCEAWANLPEKLTLLSRQRHSRIKRCWLPATRGILNTLKGCMLKRGRCLELHVLHLGENTHASKSLRKNILKGKQVADLY